MTLREFTIGDYEATYQLWQNAEGIGLSEADQRENVARFLAVNPGLSFIAEQGGRLVGGLLCGSDGRRGFLYHLAVEKSHRRAGIGRALVQRCLAALASAGMRKCHIFVMADNQEGKLFWKRNGWEERTTLVIMSHDVAASPAGDR